MLVIFTIMSLIYLFTVLYVFPLQAQFENTVKATIKNAFLKDGLGAIVNSSRGIIAAYQQEKYAQFGAANYADASRQAVIDMREDIAQALQGRK